MKRRWVLTLLAAIAVAALVLSVTCRQLVVPLLFGWIAYLERVLPETVIRWDGVAVFLIGLLLFTLLMHKVAAWLRWEMSGHTAVWRWRSSFLMAGLVVTMFVAGVALVGVTHQAAWLANDEGELLVPALPADRNASKWNLKVIGMGVQNYRAVFLKLPSDDNGHGWSARMLPHLNMSSNIDLEKPWNHPRNEAEARKLVPVLLNPGLRPTVLRDADGYGVSHYAGNTKLFDDPKVKKIDGIGDGTSHTLMIGEVHANFQAWARPGTNRDPALGINRSPHGFGGPTANRGALFVMADGSVRFLSRDTDPAVLKALSTPNGNETIDQSELGW